MAATRPSLSAGFDAGRCRGQKTPPTETRLRPQVGQDPCGSGLGRDAAVAVRRLRCRPLSGSEDPSHRNPAPAAIRERFLWERPWPRPGRRCLQASMQAAVGVRRPLPQKLGTGSARESGTHCGSGLGRDAAVAVRRLRCRLRISPPRGCGGGPFSCRPDDFRRGRSGRRSSPWSRPRRSRGRTFPCCRPVRRPRRRRAGWSSNRTPDRRGWPSISPDRSCG